MTNFEFLQKYLRLQDGVLTDSLTNLNFALLSYSETDKTPFANFALVNKALLSDQISDVEKTFTGLERASTFYFEHRPDLAEFQEQLTDLGYEKSFEDSWQFWANGKIDNKYFSSIKKVMDEKDLSVFLKTFNECYKKGDPQNPYGELGDFLKLSELTWHNNHSNGKLEYFLAYKENVPVAVSALTNFENLGYISSVGSLRTVRGEGFGKAITLYAVKQSIKHGNAIHCLGTEEGAYPNEFYKRIGFKTKFSAVAYTKISKKPNKI